MCSVLQHYFIILKHNYYFRATIAVPRMAATSNLELGVLAANGCVLLVQNVQFRNKGTRNIEAKMDTSYIFKC